MALKMYVMREEEVNDGKELELTVRYVRDDLGRGREFTFHLDIKNQCFVPGDHDWQAFERARAIPYLFSDHVSAGPGFVLFCLYMLAAPVSFPVSWTIQGYRKHRAEKRHMTRLGEKFYNAIASQVMVNTRWILDAALEREWRRDVLLNRTFTLDEAREFLKQQRLQERREWRFSRDPNDEIDGPRQCIVRFTWFGDYPEISPEPIMVASGYRSANGRLQMEVGKSKFPGHETELFSCYRGEREIVEEVEPDDQVGPGVEGIT